MQIVIDDKIPYIKGVLEPFFDVQYIAGSKITNKIITDCDALIVRTRTKCNRELLEGSKVQYVATATIGFDHIDTDYCAENNIEYTTAAGCNANAVVNYVVAAIAQTGSSPKETIGIIGCGNVGSRLKNVCEELGFRVLVNDPPKGLDKGENSLDFLLANSDIITIHTPLVRSGKYKTENMANDLFFSRLKQGVLFINSSRGEVVDESALIKAIYSGKVGKSVIDVWRDEPNINSELCKIVDFATTHIAGYSRKGKERATEMSVNNIGKKFNIPELANWRVNSPESNLLELIWSEVEKNTLQNLNFKNLTQNLRSGSDNFEQIRQDYPLREESF